MASNRRRAIIAAYEQNNRHCAQIILKCCERYGGAESLMVRWARQILDERPTEHDNPQLELILERK